MAVRGFHASPPLVVHAGDALLSWEAHGSSNSSSPFHSYAEGVTKGNL